MPREYGSGAEFASLSRRAASMPSGAGRAAPGQDARILAQLRQWSAELADASYLPLNLRGVLAVRATAAAHAKGPGAPERQARAHADILTALRRNMRPAPWR